MKRARALLMLILLLLLALTTLSCNGYASIGIGGPYVGVGPVGISGGVSIGFPL